MEGREERDEGKGRGKENLPSLNFPSGYVTERGALYKLQVLFY